MIGDVHLSLNLTYWSVIAFVAVISFSIIIYMRTFPEVPRTKRYLLMFLRALSLVVLLVLLLDPKITVSSNLTRKPLVAILLDDSRSMSIEDCSAGSREAEAVEVAKMLTSVFDERGVENHTIAFSSKLAPDPFNAAEIDTIVSPEGEGTDIWRAIQEAASRYRGENLKAIVLISDGRVTSGVIESSRSPGVPVYTIGIGDTIEGPDLLIEDVTAPRQSYLGTAEIVTASLRAIGFKDSLTFVELLDGKTVVDRKPVSFESDNQKQEVKLNFLPKKEGEHELVVRARPLKSEKFDENNSRILKVGVSKSRIKILYIDSHPDWNVTFLKSIAERSKRFSIDFIVWIPAKGYIELETHKPWIFPSSVRGISSYDLICFSDDEEILSRKENVELLTKYIHDGGNLLFIADEHSPVLNLSVLRMLEPIIPIIGIARPTVWVSEYYPVKGDAPFNPLAPVIMESFEPGSIPPVSCIIRGIAVNSAAEVPINLSDSSSEVPFLIMQDVGKGVSCFLNGFPLWRWKITTASKSSFYDSFFGALIQYLTEGYRKKLIDVATDRTVYRAGEQIRVKVLLHRYALGSGLEGQLWTKEREGGKLVDRFSFNPTDLERGELERLIGPLPPGEYKIVVSSRSGEEVILRSEADISVLPQSIEFFRTSMDRELLQYVSSSTGGRMIDPGEAASFFDRQHFLASVIERRKVVFLLNSIFPFLVIVLLLSAEWIIRKAWGLV